MLNDGLLFVTPSPIPFPFVVIWTDVSLLRSIAVRTDGQPLIWMWWWMVVRVEESARLTSSFLIYLLQIWGLAKLKPGTVPRWRDVWVHVRSLLTKQR